MQNSITYQSTEDKIYIEVNEDLRNRKKNYACKTSFINSKYGNSKTLRKHIWEIKITNDNTPKYNQK